MIVKLKAKQKRVTEELETVASWYERRLTSVASFTKPHILVTPRLFIYIILQMTIDG